MKIQRKQVRAEVPSTAMGDIAFNLLIFLVILARANDDSFLNWQPARARNLEAAGYAKASVLIDAQSKLYLNGRQVGTSQLSREIGELLGDAPAGKRTVLSTTSSFGSTRPPSTPIRSGTARGAADRASAPAPPAARCGSSACNTRAGIGTRTSGSGRT